jgi:hypothetical protein
MTVAILTIACDLIVRTRPDTENVPVEQTESTFQSTPAVTIEPSNQLDSTEPAPSQTIQPSVAQLSTNTPAQTITPEATQESIEIVTTIEPFLDAPECTEHDGTMWHGLWNANIGCHYDHTHNADPFATEFAERVATWDQSISYPWQTSHENSLKHQGYKYAYVSDLDCSKRIDDGDNCVKASLIQLHAIGSQVGITTRFHSYRAIALISEGVNDEPGIIELGGHSDFGILHCPYKDQHCSLPNDPSDVDFSLMQFHPPYRATASLAGLERELESGMIIQSWNSGWQPSVSQYYPVRYNLLFEFDFQSADAWGVVNPDDLTQLHLVCPTGDCPYNHSTLRIYEIVIRVPQELAGTDGRVNYVGFTDVQGNISDECTSVGAECVPLIIENAPVGLATFRLPVGNLPLSVYPDYDIFFDGVTSGWIQYPN